MKEHNHVLNNYLPRYWFDLQQNGLKGISQQIKGLWELYNKLKIEEKVKYLYTSKASAAYYSIPMINSLLDNAFVSSTEQYLNYEIFKPSSGELILCSENTYTEEIFSRIFRVESVKYGETSTTILEKIISVIKVVAAIIRTKFTQLEKINKRNLYRQQVNLIYKNMDDAHSNFELFVKHNSNIIFQKIKNHSYEQCNRYSRTFNRIPK